MYYFDKITCNFYPAEGAESYYPDIDFSQMKQVDEATFQRIINGDGARAADDDGNPILIPNAPSQYHIWNGTEWVISDEGEVGLLTEQR
ncbi:hypothetical protein JL12_09895, partial [Gallibacterium anatis 10672-6]